MTVLAEAILDDGNAKVGGMNEGSWIGLDKYEELFGMGKICVDVVWVAAGDNERIDAKSCFPAVGVLVGLPGLEMDRVSSDNVKSSNDCELVLDFGGSEVV